MEKLNIGGTVLYKMTALEFNEAWHADVEEQYGQGVKALYWATVEDDNGEEVCMTAEVMLEFEEQQFAYTSRGYTQRATNMIALKMMLDSMEEI